MKSKTKNEEKITEDSEQEDKHNLRINNFKKDMNDFQSQAENQRINCKKVIFLGTKYTNIKIFNLESRMIRMENTLKLTRSYMKRILNKRKEKKLKKMNFIKTPIKTEVKESELKNLKMTKEESLSNHNFNNRKKPRNCHFSNKTTKIDNISHGNDKTANKMKNKNNVFSSKDIIFLSSQKEEESNTTLKKTKKKKGIVTIFPSKIWIAFLLILMIIITIIVIILFLRMN